jgi:hypothetical protein
MLPIRKQGFHMASPQQIQGNEFGQLSNGETREQRRDQGVNIGNPQRPHRRDCRTAACLVRKPPDIALSPVGIAQTGMGCEVVWMTGTAIVGEIGRRCDDEAPNGSQALGYQRGVLQHRDT